MSPLEQGGSPANPDPATETKQDEIIAILDPLSGNPKSFEDTSFVTGDSPVTLDINDALGRNGQKGYITNDGVGDFTVAFSNNGVDFGDEITMQADETINFSDWKVSIDSIRITWLADSAYRVAIL